MPGGVAGQFAAHQVLLVALCTQQAGAAGGGGATAAVEAVSMKPPPTTTVDQGRKSLTEMRQVRQVHPNMESVFSIQTCNL